MNQSSLKQIPNQECGFILIFALITLFVLTALGTYATNTSIVESWRSSNYKSSKQAFYSAEAGIQDGMSRLVRGAITDTGSETTTTWNAGTNYNSSNNFDNSFTVSHRLTGSPATVSKDTNGNPYYVIRSSGSSGTAQKTIEAIISLKITNNSPFTDALTGCDGVTFSGNATTNSYRSSGNPANGNMGGIRTTNANANISFDSNTNINGEVLANGNISLASNTDLHTISVKADGNITMTGNAIIDHNAFSGGNISLANNSHIYGNATAAGTITHSGNSKVDGTQSPNTPPASPYVPTSSCDPLNVTTLFTNANTNISGSNNNSDLSSSYYSSSSRAFSIGGNNTYTLGTASQTKKYYFSSFTMDSNSVITLQGNVTLYVNGNFTLLSNSRINLASGASLTIYDTGTFTLNSNTSINNNGAPQNLIIYSNAQSSSHTDYKVSMDSNSGLRGVVYAPNSSIHLSSNSDLYGAVRGDFVNNASNTTFHYDEDLVNANIGGGRTITGYNLLNWRQIFY